VVPLHQWPCPADSRRRWPIYPHTKPPTS
jgi:hypothetical protein